GPVVSLDKGRTWAYPRDGACALNRFTYTFPKDADEVWFYECHPYNQSDWEAFLARHADARGKAFETGVLCKTKKGRDVERARFGCLTNPKYTMLLTSRHHASEAVATYALEGFLEAVLGQDELGEWLRKNVEVMVVPFMDKDGCVDGDQGKNRKPHDHNRDYTEFIHHETRATVAWIKERTNDQLDVWLDLHCPWIRGNYNEFVYSPLKRDVNNRNAAAEARFDALLEKLQCGSLRYKAANDLPYGKAWNTGGNYEKGWSSINWAINTLPAIKLGHTFEIPFATANGAVVTPEKVRAFGRDLAKTLRAFLEK
ncbi:MAG: M14 family zinc carboxypeptidase, partial [Kiritimatiellia bacterium]